MCMICYESYNRYQTIEVKKEIIFFIVRFIAYVVSIFPYFFVPIFWSEDFVKVNVVFDY